MCEPLRSYETANDARLFRLNFQCTRKPTNSSQVFWGRDTTLLVPARLAGARGLNALRFLVLFWGASGSQQQDVEVLVKIVLLHCDCAGETSLAS